MSLYAESNYTTNDISFQSHLSFPSPTSVVGTLQTVTFQGFAR